MIVLLVFTYARSRLPSRASSLASPASCFSSALPALALPRPYVVHVYTGCTCLPPRVYFLAVSASLVLCAYALLHLLATCIHPRACSTSSIHTSWSYLPRLCSIYRCMQHANTLDDPSLGGPHICLTAPMFIALVWGCICLARA